MQPPDGGNGSGRRPALVDTAALATDIPELRQQDKAKEEKVMGNSAVSVSYDAWWAASRPTLIPGLTMTNIGYMDVILFYPKDIC